jgi:hypothetical protein
MMAASSRHCEPFDAACGGAQDKLPRAAAKQSSAAFDAGWIASSLRSSQ